MADTAFKSFSYLHQKNSVVFLRYLILTLAGSELRPHILKLLCRDKEDLAVGSVCKNREMISESIRRIADGADDGSHRVLKILSVSVLRQHYFFPVPLVNIDAVKIVGYLIAPDGVHIRIETALRLEFVSEKGKPFPLCERMDNLSVHSNVRNIKADRSFHSVKVIVKSRTSVNEERRRDSVKVQPYR